MRLRLDADIIPALGDPKRFLRKGILSSKTKRHSAFGNKCPTNRKKRAAELALGIGNA
jgi:hypothetical protein